jgi:hypothetical protein
VKHGVHTPPAQDDVDGAWVLDWRHRSACLGDDPRLYIPANPSEPDQRAEHRD